MPRTLILFICSIACSMLTAQESMRLKDGKSYPASLTWDFICENYALSGATSIQIARTEKGGLLKIGVETTDAKFTISGTVYLYLRDNTFIICKDKNWRDVGNKQIYSYYMLTAIEMNRLKETEISSIRYTIKGKLSPFSSQIGSFTALNKKKYFTTVYDSTIKSFDTASAIKALY